MKKNKLLMVLALSTTCLFSIASCGAQGEKGETGDKGETGEKGDTGTPGKDGENGKDGTSFLNGEGVPSDTLGNDGDSYVDTTTFDYYTKENGKWIKKGSIKGDKGDTGDKGETGDQGEKGDTGSKGDKGDTGSSGTPGSKGETGNTAYSNTILYSEYGYITPSAGSMIADDKNEISFTVHHNDYNEARLTGLTLKNPLLNDDGEKTITIDSNEEGYKVVAADDDSHDYTFTTKMLEGGFVVSANFSEKDKEVSIPDNISASDGTIVDSNGSGVKYFEGDTVTLKFTFVDGRLIKSFKVNEESKTFDDLKLSTDKSYYYYEATVGDKGVNVTDVVYESGYVFNTLTFGDDVTVSANKNYYYINSNDSLTLSFNFGSSAIEEVTIGGEEVTLTNNTYKIENITKKIEVNVQVLVSVSLIYEKYTENDTTKIKVSGIASGSSADATAVNIEKRKVETENPSFGYGYICSIGDGIFENRTSLTYAYMPGTVENIGSKAFKGCTALKKVIIDNEAVDYTTHDLKIGDYAFQNCTSLTEITIPNRVTSMGDNRTFSGCTNLRTVIIGDNVETIANYAFENCSNLEMVVIGSSVRSIGSQAFAGTRKTSSKGGTLKLFYHGAKPDNSYPPEINNPDIDNVSLSDLYYFYENEEDVPDDDGKYWHYVEGVPTVWEK